MLVLDAYDFMCDSCGDVQSLALMAMLRATFKFYRQATDQIVGTSYKGASFLNGFF